MKRTAVQHRGMVKSFAHVTRHQSHPEPWPHSLEFLQTIKYLSIVLYAAGKTQGGPEFPKRLQRETAMLLDEGFDRVTPGSKAELCFQDDRNANRFHKHIDELCF